MEIKRDEYLESLMAQKVPLIQFDLFADIPFLNHGFTTRKGGVSEGIFSTLNLSFTRGDDPDRVMKNYEILADTIGTTTNQFVASDQTHTTNIRIVKECDAGKGITRPKDYTDVDGLMTDQAGLVLVTYYADCVPLFFVDRKKKVVAVSHSGWKGTLGKMGLKTIETMCEVFGSEREDILCAIGPSICRDCYEVSEDLRIAFQGAFKESVLNEIFTPKDNGKYLLDLWAANEHILSEAGIPAEHIENRRICTCCHKELLFSHRGLQGKRGNLAAFIGIR